MCSLLILVSSEELVLVVSLQLSLSSVNWLGRLLMQVIPLWVWTLFAALRWSGFSPDWVISGKTTPWLDKNCANQHGDVTSVALSTCTPEIKLKWNWFIFVQRKLILCAWITAWDPRIFICKRATCTRTWHYFHFFQRFRTKTILQRTLKWIFFCSLSALNWPVLCVHSVGCRPLVSHKL